MPDIGSGSKSTAAKPAKSPPKLVNRGPAGLLTKLPKTGGAKPGEGSTPSAPPPARNKISPALRKAGMVVPIDSLTSDPQNARQHGDRNIESIKASLSLYGQQKPIVVRKETMVVVAGNGTLESAKALGWTEIAAVVSEMTEVEAIGYGLADNRTAELAKWNFEVVARLDKILQEAGHEAVGWSKDELEVLRAADWTPPAVEGGSGFGDGGSDPGEKDPLIVSFTPDDYAIVGPAIATMRKIQKKEGMSQAGALTDICREWAKLEASGRLGDLLAEIEAEAGAAGDLNQSDVNDFDCSEESA